MLNLKKGSQVKVISGKDKGKTGEILEINRSLNRVKIKTINMIKKHLKPTKENKGGIITKEGYIPAIIFAIINAIIIYGLSDKIYL